MQSPFGLCLFVAPAKLTAAKALDSQSNTSRGLFNQDSNKKAAPEGQLFIT
jgi:hypothetical protein